MYLEISNPMDYHAALYIRLSKEDESEGPSQSVTNQKSLLDEFVQKHRLQVYDTYIDDGWSGTNFDRPDFQRMIGDIEAKKVNMVITKDLSRLGRDYIMTGHYMERYFPEKRVRYISLLDGIDTGVESTANDITPFRAIMNDMYAKDISKKIKSVKRDKQRKGQFIGGKPVYGYKMHPTEKNKIIIDEEVAPIVRRIFAMALDGVSCRQIAAMLNEEGVPTPATYCGWNMGRKGPYAGLWSSERISDMLQNETYIGNMVQGKYGSVSYKTKQNKPRPKSEWYIVEGTHEPIIDRELWDRVQALIEQRAKPFDVGTIGLFARKARCANCGYTMRSSKNHNKHYLQCSNRHVAKDACIGSFISVDKLEKMVIDELNRLAAEYLDKDELEQNIEFCDNLQGQKKRLLSDLTVYQKKVDEYSKGIRELYMDKVKGLISESDYVDMSKGFTTERDRLERVIADGEKQLAEIEEKIAAGDNRRELIEQYTNLEHLTREIVETLIDYISVGKRIPGTRDVPIEIHWNF